ncbi:hypothetical protein M422DRAFT_274561, partial [Sphaerobolus stellatus SS14]
MSIRNLYRNMRHSEDTGSEPDLNHKKPSLFPSLRRGTSEPSADDHHGSAENSLKIANNSSPKSLPSVFENIDGDHKLDKDDKLTAAHALVDWRKIRSQDRKKYEDKIDGIEERLSVPESEAYGAVLEAGKT